MLSAARKGKKRGRFSKIPYLEVTVNVAQDIHWRLEEDAARFRFEDVRNPSA